jgi:alpha-beta hydrolase superfamily lysophospholipase
MLTRGDSFTLIHNPSRSFLQDAIETFQDTMGSGSKASKQLRSLLTDASNRGLSIDLFAHSQGGAITASAMRAGAISGVTLNFVGAPITESSARAMVLGRNGNLMQMLGAALNAPRLFLSCRNSPHSACAYAGGP